MKVNNTKYLNNKLKIKNTKSMIVLAAPNTHLFYNVFQIDLQKKIYTMRITNIKVNRKKKIKIVIIIVSQY